MWCLHFVEKRLKRLFYSDWQLIAVLNANKVDRWMWRRLETGLLLRPLPHPQLLPVSFIAHFVQLLRSQWHLPFFCCLFWAMINSWGYSPWWTTTDIHLCRGRIMWSMCACRLCAVCSPPFISLKKPILLAHLSSLHEVLVGQKVLCRRQYWSVKFN